MGLQYTQFSRQIQIGVFQLSVRSVHSAASCHHNEIPAWLELGFVCSVDLPQTAADSVARHCMAELFGDGNAQTDNRAETILHDVNDHELPGLVLSAAIEGAEAMIFI